MPDDTLDSALAQNLLYVNLDPSDKDFIRKIAAAYRLTRMDLQNIITACCDLEMWEQGSLSSFWPEEPPEESRGPVHKKKILALFYEKYNRKKKGPKSYDGMVKEFPAPAYRIQTVSGKPTILGTCPVASEKTRCCNLQTLDAVINCGFNCSYCTIAPFYGSTDVYFHDDLQTQLDRIPIDSSKLYHIGTGQSSDSLLWGNSHGLLDILFDFAERHPNVILELKTKAALPDYMKNTEIPPNVLTTWTLNTPKVILNEEKGTASLEKRIEGACETAAKGNLTGFHFHPMVYYDGWEDEYAAIARKLTASIDPVHVAMVSIGTLTFIKPVIRKIRERKLPTSILQMELEETAGKYSYPLNVKQSMFSHLYSCFTPWHDRVFFYLCMEPPSLWKPVFGFEFDNNAEFESAMKESYIRSIQAVRKQAAQ
ncbi:MAG: hypothetical protein JXB03_11780 [Spirochaetales bacterium]|nr:hypothetical protein [Spirochaetales bacterium]